MLTKKLTHIIYKSINEAFDFDDVECTAIDGSMEDYSSEAVAAFNKDIGIEQMFNGYFKLPFPSFIKTQQTVGNHLIYCRKNPDVFSTSIPDDDCEEIGESGEVFHFAITTIIHGIGITTKIERTFLNARWKIITSIKTRRSTTDEVYYADPDTLPQRTIETINEVISAVIHEDYDIRQSAYSNSLNNGDHKVFYKIYISPDNGVLFIDHISKYAKPLNTHRWCNYKFHVTEPPQYWFNCGILYSGSIGYKIKKAASELSADTEKFKYDSLIKSYIKAVEEGCYIACMSDGNYNLSTDNIYRPDGLRTLMYDRNDHIWYPAVCNQTIWGRCKLPSQYHRYEAPEKWFPLDFTKLPKNFKISSFCFSAPFPKLWKLVVKHPKIIGYQNPAYPGFIVYCVSDLMFAEKLLGPGTIEHLMKYGQTYIKGEQPGKFYRCFPFIWFNDQGMQDIDNYIDNPSIRLASLTKSIKNKNSPINN